MSDTHPNVDALGAHFTWLEMQRRLNHVITNNL